MGRPDLRSKALAALVGPLIQDLREDRGITRKALAIHLGASIENLRQIELGAQCPRVHVLLRIASALSCDLEDLLPHPNLLPHGFLPGSMVKES